MLWLCARLVHKHEAGLCHLTKNLLDDALDGMKTNLKMELGKLPLARDACHHNYG